VNAYLREITGSDVTAKDFRTWGGTMLAAVELRRLGAAASRREADRNVIAAVDAVAERLGNTRAVCRKYYVHPALLSAYLMGRTVPTPPPLRRRHVQVKGATLRFSFRGKSGIEHDVSITDRRLARIVQRCRDLPGTEMFQYVDAFGRRQTVSSDDVNERLREISGRDVTAKDFRTWGGTMHAAVALRAMGPAASRREADRNIVRAIDEVAERLGNTRAVCRKYYVHPAILEAYLLGRTAPLPPEAPARGERRGRGVAALRRDEVAVLQFLNNELDGEG